MFQHFSFIFITIYFITTKSYSLIAINKSRKLPKATRSRSKKKNRSQSKIPTPRARSHSREKPTVGPETDEEGKTSESDDENGSICVSECIACDFGFAHTWFFF